MTTPQTNFNGVLRDMTETEIKEYEATVKAMQENEEALENAKTARQSAIAKLELLGLTADEAAALFG